MADARERVKDVGGAVFLSSAAVSLVGLWLTSGVSKDLVNQAIDTAGGGTANADDYLTVATVAMAAFPLVAALLISYVIFAYTDWDIQGKWLAVIVTWVVAGGISSSGDPVEMELRFNTTTGPPFLRALAWGVGETTAPYSGVLLVQAIVVAAATVISFEWLRRKWAAPATP